MKKIRLRSILLVVLTIGLFWYILKDNFSESVSLLLSSNIWYLLLVVVTYIVYFLVEAYLLYLLINKVNNSYSYRQTLELNLMTKFFNGITPFSLGGQPFQVYELSKSKVRVTESLLVIVENFIVLQISMTIMSLICMEHWLTYVQMRTKKKSGRDLLCFMAIMEPCMNQRSLRMPIRSW